MRPQLVSQVVATLLTFPKYDKCLVMLPGVKQAQITLGLKKNSQILAIAFINMEHFLSRMPAAILKPSLR